MVPSRPRCRVVAIFFAGLTLVCLASGPATGGGGAAKKKDVKDSFEAYLKELRQRFNAWDTNDDNVLDKGELAKVFRGKQARPYDQLAPEPNPPAAPPPPPQPTKGKVRPFALALCCLPRPGLAVNLALAELLTKPEKSNVKPPVVVKEKERTLSPAVMQYGDFQFLALVGKNDRVTRTEFDNWSMTYAKNLDRHQDLERGIKALKDRVAKTKNKKEKLTDAKELAQHQAELKTVAAKLNLIPQAIHKALNVKK